MPAPNFSRIPIHMRPPRPRRACCAASRRRRSPARRKSSRRGGAAVRAEVRSGASPPPRAPWPDAGSRVRVVQRYLHGCRSAISEAVSMPVSPPPMTATLSALRIGANAPFALPRALHELVVRNRAVHKLSLAVDGCYARADNFTGRLRKSCLYGTGGMSSPAATWCSRPCRAARRRESRACPGVQYGPPPSHPRSRRRG